MNRPATPRRRAIVQAATLALTAAALLLPVTASAAFPERPIALVVPYAPGGAADALARVLAAKMSEKLGSNIVVENRAGASGTIGEAYVAHAKPDGYTMLYTATPFSINPHLIAKMPFGPDALQPLSLVSLAPNVVIVPAASKLQTLDDLIATAKANPGKLNFASGGGGTVQRLAAELFRQKLGLDMVHIPYKSGGPAIADVMAGQVDFMFSTIAASYPLVQSGKLRALGISSPQRSERLPDVPTVAEKAIPGYEVYEWNGVLVPAGTPADVTKTLHDALVGALADPGVRQRLTDVGAQVVGSTPQEFETFLKNQDSLWSEVVRKGNIKMD